MINAAFPVQNGSIIAQFSGFGKQKRGIIDQNGKEEKGLKEEKKDEKKPVPWEMTDPRPPVIESSRGENHRRHDVM